MAGDQWVESLVKCMVGANTLLASDHFERQISVKALGSFWCKQKKHLMCRGGMYGKIHISSSYICSLVYILCVTFCMHCLFTVYFICLFTVYYTLYGIYVQIILLMCGFQKQCRRADAFKTLVGHWLFLFSRTASLLTASHLSTWCPVMPGTTPAWFISHTKGRATLLHEPFC